MAHMHSVLRLCRIARLGNSEEVKLRDKKLMEHAANDAPLRHSVAMMSVADLVTRGGRSNISCFLFLKRSCHHSTDKRSSARRVASRPFAFVEEAEVRSR